MKDIHENDRECINIKLREVFDGKIVRNLKENVDTSDIMLLLSRLYNYNAD